MPSNDHFEQGIMHGPLWSMPCLIRQVQRTKGVEVRGRAERKSQNSVWLYIMTIEPAEVHALDYQHACRLELHT